MTKKNFDFQGLDDLSKKDLFLKNIVSLEDELRKIYIDRLQNFNKESLEQNPEPFRFLEKENCSILCLILPHEFDFSRAAQFFILSTPQQRKEELFVLTEDDLRDLDSYEHIYQFFNNKILPLKGYNASQIIFEVTDYYYNLALQAGHTIFEEHFNLDVFIRSHSLLNLLLTIIKRERTEFQTINKTPLSYFAKDVFKFPFSILDLKPLVELVNDDDFTYQLDQAMAAYHENLFLPCAATLGVVLETLCIKILENNGIKKVKSGDTQLGKLIERLSSEQITSRRNNTRLEVAYKMRNMASHASPGIALKEDCHFMLNVINTIAFDYLGQD